MRYFIGALVAVGLIILVIVLLFGGGNSGDNSSKKYQVGNYNTAASTARLVIDGPVSASETHYQAEIIVDQSQAVLNVIRGYEGEVIDSKSYPINTNSYAVFLRSLDKAGFTKGNDDADKKDERGVCPNGRRYVYEFRNNDKLLERYWSTTCGAATYKGNNSLTRSLFEAQVPDYQDMVNRVSL